MPQYVPIFSAEGEITTDGDLRRGDALLLGGVVWLVAAVEPRYVGPAGVRLTPWPREDARAIVVHVASRAEQSLDEGPRSVGHT
jgi:hypothetical protein